MVSWLVLCRFAEGQQQEVRTYPAIAQWVEEEMEQHSSMLYNGEVYVMAAKSATSHQFLGDRSWKEGTIHYMDQEFHRVSFVYDINEEVLVIKNPYGLADGVQLFMPEVASFTIGNRSFYAFEREGFYELLFKGEHFDFVCRREKREEAESRGIVYKEQNTYYLIKEGEWFPIKSKASMSHPYSNAKELMNVINKKYKARYSRYNEAHLIEFIEYFDHELEN